MIRETGARRRRRLSRLAGPALVASLVVGCSGDSPGPGGEPPSSTLAASEEGAAAEGSPWPTTTPRRAGFDEARLTRIARDARRERSTCLAVVRDGRLVREWNWHGLQPDEPREVFSVTKSVASALVGIAIRDGLVSLDQPASRWITAWRGTPSADVTIRDLLTNSSGRFWSLDSDYRRLIGAPDRTEYAVGLSQQVDPGTIWAYNNAAIQTLDRVLSEATGTTAAAFADKELFGPLGMADSRLTRDTSGRSTNLFFGMQTTCRDLARFGQLYLDGGVHDGTRILPRSYVAESHRPGTDLNAAYGFLWWLNRSRAVDAGDAADGAGQPLEARTGQLAPDAPVDLFAAQGLGGQTVLVSPGTRTVVVRLGLLPEDRRQSYTAADAARVVTQALRR